MARRYPRVSGSAAAKALSRAAFVATGGLIPALTLLAPSALIAARWTPEPEIFRSSSGIYSTNFDPVSMIPALNRTLYVDPVNGSNSNTGIGTGAAVQQLGNAMTKAQPGDRIEIINLTEDVVVRGIQGWPVSPGFANSITVINRTAFRYIVAGASQTVNNWSQHPTYSHVYSCTSGNPTSVTDCYVKHYAFRQLTGGTGYAAGDTVNLTNGAIITVRGVVDGAVRVWTVTRMGSVLVPGTVTQTATSGTGTGLTFESQTQVPSVLGVNRRAATLEEMAANRGTYFYDGTQTHMNPIDGRAVAEPSPRIVIGLGNNVININTAANITQYFEGIDIVGGSAGVSSAFAGTAARPRIVMNRCTFQGSATNGFSIASFSQIYLHRCAAFYCGADGFSLHNSSFNAAEVGTSPTGFHNECVGQGNGTVNSPASGANGTSDNDFTNHEEGVGVYVNCVSCGSDDRCAAFIGNSLTWWLGGFIGTAKTALTGAVSANLDLSDAAVMWIDGAIVPPSMGANEAFKISTGTTLYHRNMVPPPTSTGAGTIAAY